MSGRALGGWLLLIIFAVAMLSHWLFGTGSPLDDGSQGLGPVAAQTVTQQ